MGKILLNNIRLYAYHGCLEEEAKIGSDYRVDLIIEADLSRSAASDELKDTVDYVHLTSIIKEEMAQRSKLLEHVAERINQRIFDELPAVKETTVSVSKLNPPLNADCEAVTIELTKRR
ncbi:MAG: dihydroneopterin aldolase [Psychroflexus sp.]|nr:dihydroneopterin aldolase [Psychroflexus sp.]